jgi:hypothetical protein
VIGPVTLDEHIQALCREYAYHKVRGAKFAEREFSPEISKWKSLRRQRKR